MDLFGDAAAILNSITYFPKHDIIALWNKIMDEISHYDHIFKRGRGHYFRYLNLTNHIIEFENQPVKYRDWHPRLAQPLDMLVSCWVICLYFPILLKANETPADIAERKEHGNVLNILRSA